MLTDRRVWSSVLNEPWPETIIDVEKFNGCQVFSNTELCLEELTLISLFEPYIINQGTSYLGANLGSPVKMVQTYLNYTGKVNGRG